MVSCLVISHELSGSVVFSLSSPCRADFIAAMLRLMAHEHGWLDASSLNCTMISLLLARLSPMPTLISALLTSNMVRMLF